jgi:hypothetical protein
MYRPDSLGRLFWHTLALTGAPLVHRGQSKEVEWPYRYARPFIFRLPRGKGLAVGWWHEHKTLDVGRHLAECMVLGTPEHKLLTDGDAWVGESGVKLDVDVSPVDLKRDMRKAAKHVEVTVL